MIDREKVLKSIESIENIKNLKKILDAKKIRRSFMMNSLFLNLIYLLIFTANLYSVYDVFYLNHEINLLKIFFPVALFFYLMFSTYKPILLNKRINIKKYSKEQLGHFSITQINKIITEVIKPIKVKHKEIPNFYILESSEANAFCVDLLFFNFIRPLNAIYISEKFFHILNEKELRAVIAHEIAHFRFYMNIFYRDKINIYLFFSLFPLFVTNFFYSLSGRYAFVITVVIYFVIKICMGILINRNQKHLEYLSDYYAASKYGKIDSINMLLAMGRLNDIDIYYFKLIFEHIKSSCSINAGEISDIIKIVEQEIKYEIYSKKELKKMIKHIFNKKILIIYTQELSDSQRKERDSIINKYMTELTINDKEKIINWELFDFDVKDKKINEIEYPYLIKTLLDFPDKQLFEAMFDNIAANELGNHPTTAERILFLHKNVK